jgi:hypothetical protein
MEEELRIMDQLKERERELEKCLSETKSPTGLFLANLSSWEITGFFFENWCRINFN